MQANAGRAHLSGGDGRWTILGKNYDMPIYGTHRDRNESHARESYWESHVLDASRGDSATTPTIILGAG